VELVIDGTPPSITCPGDILTAAPDGSWSATVNVGSPTATDGLSGIKSIVGQRSDGLALAAPYPVGGTTITWTATDKSDNQSTCQQLVVVGPPGFTGQLVKTVAEAKQLADGTGIALLSPIVTRSLTDADCYYVEDFDRTAGIRVDHIYGDWPAESDEPAVFGTIQTIAGERVVSGSTSAPYDDGVVPDSLCMVARECCWPLAQGLFATICGRAAVAPSAVDEFLLCDGSHNPLTVQLHTGASCPAAGEFVRVTGVLGAQGTQAVLHVNADSDVLLVPE